jgi:hypothetical protein
VDYLFLAMCRSGHHAVLYWLAKQLPGRVEHLNHCMGGWKEKKLKPLVGTEIINNKGEGNSTLYSVEEFDMYDWNKYGIDEFSPERRVLVVRDPFNWVASSIKKEGAHLNNLFDCYTDDKGDYPTSPTTELWCRQVKEAVGESQIIPGLIVVNYNKWFFDIKYRKKLSERLEVKFSDEGLSIVPQWGRGSSFDERKYNGRAQEMGVLSRWRIFVDNPIFKRVAEDEVINSLSVNFFGLRWNKETKKVENC